MQEILQELELPLGDRSQNALIRQLNRYLIEIFSRNDTLALIIDEAQNLSKEVLEELRLLFNLEPNKCKLLQIVLVGQPELEAKLNSEELRQLRQRIGIRRQIRPLTEVESKHYMNHRLIKVGSSMDKIFTKEAVSLICRYAEGIPRTINVLCDNALLTGFRLGKKRIGEDIVKEALGYMGYGKVDQGLQTKDYRPQSTVSRPWSPKLEHEPSTMAHGLFSMSHEQATIRFKEILGDYNGVRRGNSTPLIPQDVNWVEMQKLNQLKETAEEISKMVSDLIASIKKSMGTKNS